MAKGILGVIICPMLDDNLVYSLDKDPERKDIVLANTGNQGPIVRRLERSGIPYRISGWDDIISGNAELDREGYIIVREHILRI